MPMRWCRLLMLGVLSLFGANIPSTAPAPVEIQIKNVNLRLDDDIVLQIKSLRGQMISTGRNLPVSLDDKNSFVTKIDAGEIGISVATLSALLNKNVFDYPGSPMKHMSLSINGDKIRQAGTIHKGVDLPFELEGPLSCTPDGQIRLHAEKIRSAHVPVKGLLHLFGENLSKLISLRGARGIQIIGDDIILFPDRIIPPPRMEGKVVAVRIEGNNVVQVFGSGQVPRPLSPPQQAENYIYHRGGTLRFGKLLMQDADLEIVDLDKRPPFEFYFLKYSEQLVAGYSKTTPSQGLVVFMPDYSTLRARRTSVAAR